MSVYLIFSINKFLKSNIRFVLFLYLKPVIRMLIHKISYDIIINKYIKFEKIKLGAKSDVAVNFGGMADRYCRPPNLYLLLPLPPSRTGM